MSEFSESEQAMIEKLAGAVVAEYQSACPVHELVGEVQSIKKSLSGNGDPTSSLIARLDRIEEYVKHQMQTRKQWINNILWRVVAPILTAAIVAAVVAS
jgi:hypothetical protein